MSQAVAWGPLALSLVSLAMLMGIGLILFVPFFPGLALIAGAIVAYVAYASYRAGTLAGMAPVSLVLVVTLAAIGLTSAWWSEKLGLRFTYMAPTVMWGALIGSFVGILIFGMPGMLIGLVAGTVAMELRGGRPLPESLRHGVASLLAMLGPRGFQLLIALIVVSLGLTGLTRL